MNRKRLRLAALLMAIVAAGFAVLLLTDSSSTRRTKTLPDGSVLTLRRITKGTKHRCVSGNVFQRTVGRVLPETWAKKLGAQVASYDSGTNTHVFWLERTGSSNQLRRAAFSTGPPLRISTEAGFDRLYTPVHESITSVSELGAVRFDAVPTDCRLLQVAAGRNPFDRSTCVTLDVPNPNFISRRRWPLQPCPVSVEQDEVSLHLEGFTIQAKDLTNTIRTLALTELSFVIRDRAVPTNNWFARRIQIFNEAANEFSDWRPTEARLSRTQAIFPFGLSSAESYKVRFELRRTSYSPNEQHAFLAVPVPMTKGLHPPPLHAQLQGFTLVLVLASGGAIKAHIEPSKDGWRLDLASAVDNHGRWLQARRAVTSTDTEFSGTIALEPDSASLDVTFALTPMQTLELIAQPSLRP